MPRSKTPDSCETANSPDKEFSRRDRAEVARLVGKYGRPRIVALAQTVPLPRPAHRPKGSDDPSLDAEDIAWCIQTWAEEHRAAGSRKPVHDAMMDLYEVIEAGRPRPRAFGVWSRTIKRRRSTARRKIEALDVLARESAAKFRSAKNTQD